MLAVPHIAPNVKVSVIQSPDDLRYRLTPSHRGGGSVVPARSMPVLLLMDGVRTLRDIQRRLGDLGIKMPDPASLIAMVRMLEATGIVNTRHHFTSPAPIRHRCLRCGRSCEGHLVGPITDEEARQLDEFLEEFRQDEPEIGQGPATVHVQFEGKTHRVLNFPNGQCIFLTPDKHCRIHRTYGSLSEPLQCRMFPIRMIRTETGTRVVVSPRCYQTHEVYLETPPTSAHDLLEEWGVWRPPALIQGLDPNDSESLRPTPTYLENLEHERTLLQLLESEHLTLVSILTALADRVVGPNHTEKASTRQADSDFEPLLPRLPSADSQAAFGREVYTLLRCVLCDCFEIDEGTPHSRFGRNLKALLQGVMNLDDRHLAPFNDLPRPTLDFVLFSLRNHIYSRGTMVFGSVRAGVLAFCMGVVAARWLCADGDLERGPTDEFVQHQTTWIRVTSSPEIQSILFPYEASCDNLLEILACG